MPIPSRRRRRRPVARPGPVALLGLLLAVGTACAAPVPVSDQGLRAQVEAVPPVDLRDRDDPTRDPRVVSALWDAALVRQATPITARPQRRASAAGPGSPSRPLLVVAAQPPVPGLPGASPGPGTEGFAERVTGRLFFTMDGVPRTCTAQVLGSGSGAVLVTAGHCLLSTGETGRRTPARNLMFVPGYRDGAGPLGRWFASGTTVTDGWAREQDWSQDVGFVRLEDGALGLRLQQLTGALGGVFGAPVPSAVSVLGYPAAGRFDGSRLQRCDGPPAGPPDPVDPGAPALPCAMTAGYSGGAWLEAGRADELVAVSSHDYGAGTLYGARLGPGALEAFRRADAPS